MEDSKEAGMFSDRIRDLEKRIIAENADSRNANACTEKATPPKFDLASPSVNRKKPKPLLMNHSTVGPAMGRAISPDTDDSESLSSTSLLGFRDSFRLTRQRRFELALPSLPPNVRNDVARALIKKEDTQQEYEQKLAEILQKTNIITLNGVRYSATVDDLEHLGDLGHGTCGTVVKMRFRKTGDVIAVKIMRKSGNKEENKRTIRDLDVVLKSHDCPYIVRCVGCFVTDSEVWICMEMMATCLDKLLRRMKMPLPEQILGKMTVSVVKALHYLKESHGVIHRDVKPSNILLDFKGTFKLCDFGISGRLVDSKAKTQCGGCAAYLAPERIIAPEGSRPDYDIRADVWSLGISLIELATGELPYTHCKTDFEVLATIVNDPSPTLPTHRGFSMDFCAFVKECLTKDPKRRPKYKKLLEHPFIIRYELLPVDVASWAKQVTSSVAQSPFRTEALSRSTLPPAPPKPVLPVPSRLPVFSSPNRTAASTGSLNSTTKPSPTNSMGSTASSQSTTPSPQGKSWFVKMPTNYLFRSSSANIPSTAPLPRKQYTKPLNS